MSRLRRANSGWSCGQHGDPLLHCHRQKRSVCGVPIGQTEGHVRCTDGGVESVLVLDHLQRLEQHSGERGYELMADNDTIVALWSAATSAGAKPIGLGARDTLRTEMGYPLHGHELSLEITPVQASASWAVVLDKPEFTGRTALLQEKSDGPKTAMRAIKISDRGIPRAGMRVLDESGSEIGIVTSGTFSPTLKVGIALALVKPEFKSGSKITIDVRGRISNGEIVKLPFVESHVK